MKAGIYFHVPFCDGKCRYCDFYSVKYSDGLKRGYLAAAQNQIQGFPRLSADTIYFGGGTPSLLDAQDIALLIAKARQHFDIADGAEITAELNPADCSKDKLSALREAGVNRLSVGVQSLDDATLETLGRRHSAQKAVETLSDAAAAGFTNISADLMLAVPGMDEAVAPDMARRFCELPITHISAYLLKICEGTPFWFNRPPLPDDDSAAAQYEAAASVFRENGFERYEISNYTRGNNRSRHNLKYWRCADYAGIGPAAHSSIGQKRYSCAPDLQKYISDFSAVGTGFSDKLAFEGNVDGEDYIICTLRTSDGLALDELKARFGVDLLARRKDEIELLVRGGFARLEGGVLTLTDSGVLVSNSVLTKLI